MEGPFLRFFELILRVAFEFTPDVIYKRSGIAKVFLQKDLKLSLGYRNYSFTLVLALILSLLVANGFLEEQGYKQGTF